jgi:protein TonB
VSSFYVPAESLLQSRAFRRLLAFSLAGHVIVFLALVLRPSRDGQLISPSPVMVQIVAMPKAAAPKPAPAPPAPPKAQPKPPEPEPPPPPKPVVKEVVIPKELNPIPAKPKPAPAPVAKKPPPTAEELLAKMTEQVEAKEAANAPPPAPVETPAATEAAPGAFDPLLSPWVARVRALVRGNWSGASLCTGTPQFDVDIDGGGQLTHIALAESSGDSYCDDTAERALRKSNPLPPPPRALSFTLTLNPKDTQ